MDHAEGVKREDSNPYKAPVFTNRNGGSRAVFNVTYSIIQQVSVWLSACLSTCCSNRLVYLNIYLERWNWFLDPNGELNDYSSGFENFETSFLFIFWNLFSKRGSVYFPSCNFALSGFFNTLIHLPPHNSLRWKYTAGHQSKCCLWKGKLQPNYYERNSSQRPHTGLAFFTDFVFVYLRNPFTNLMCALNIFTVSPPLPNRSINLFN